MPAACSCEAAAISDADRARIYAGNALETIQSSDAKKVITVRPTAFDAAANDGSASV